MTVGMVKLNVVIPSCAESAATDVLCRVAAALFAADALAMMSCVLTVTLAGATETTATSAPGKRLSRAERKAATTKEATSPAAVRSKETTER